MQHQLTRQAGANLGSSCSSGVSAEHPLGLVGCSRPHIDLQAITDCSDKERASGGSAIKAGGDGEAGEKLPVSDMDEAEVASQLAEEVLDQRTQLPVPDAGEAPEKLLVFDAGEARTIEGALDDLLQVGFEWEQVWT